MEYIHTDMLPKAIGPYSQAIVHDGLLYSSGQIALTPDGKMVDRDIKVQVRQVLTNIRNLLESRESSMNNVIKVTIYLTDMKDFPIINVIFAEFFGDHKPARATVAVKSLPMDSMVEMDVIATVSDYH
jgi:2-iminobutanoate/2-iminopropanoate deaminase